MISMLVFNFKKTIINVTFTKLSLLIIVLINIKALFVAVAEATNSFWSSFIEYVISIF